MINIRSYKLNLHLVMAAGIMCTCVSCSSDEGSGSESAAVMNLTLSSYYNETGAATEQKWKYGDEAAVFVVGDGNSTAKQASPILAGYTNSMFLFTLDGKVGTEVTFAGFYPSTANITCSNGILKTELATAQSGKVTPCMVGRTTGRLGGRQDMTLEHLFSTVYIMIKKGSYSIVKAEFKGNNSEKIAGNISLNVDDWSVSATEEVITVTLPEPLDCTTKAQTIALMAAPVTLSGGYTVTLTDSDGQTFSATSENELAMGMGKSAYTSGIQSTYVTELVFCGDNMVYMIDAGLADETTYKDAVTWSWDATTAAGTLGIAASRCNHLDDCKIVGNNTKLLATSSYNWVVLLDIETKAVLFHSIYCSNAHSTDLLPGNRVAVACSNGSGEYHDQVQIYDIGKPNQILYKAPLSSAHGVVWNSATQRLYAAGSKSLQIYRLKDWDTSTPSIELEKTITTPQSSVHDLTLVDNNTLCVAGVKSYLYDITSETFTEMTHFTGSTQIKSLNYNADTGEAWYTDATTPEGSQTWSTQTIRYVTDVNSSTTARTIKVPDLDMYKVRVRSW